MARMKGSQLIGKLILINIQDIQELILEFCE